MLAAVPLVTGAQAPAPHAVLPHVVAAEVPQYPRSAASAGTSAVLTMFVQTDGHRVTAIIVKSPLGDSTLRDAAVKSIRTWQFTPHAPTGFDVAFKYTIVDRPCDRLGRDTHDAAVLHFPTSVEVFAERDPPCPGATRLPPVFGIYIVSAMVPVFPPAALAQGVDGDVTIGMTYKAVLSVVDGPDSLGEPVMNAIRDSWQFNPAPFGEDMHFKFTLEDGDCRGGPDVVVGPGFTRYEITDRRACGTSPLPVIARAQSR
jgi:TonB family protein